MLCKLGKVSSDRTSKIVIKDVIYGFLDSLPESTLSLLPYKMRCISILGGIPPRNLANDKMLSFHSF